MQRSLPCIKVHRPGQQSIDLARKRLRACRFSLHECAVFERELCNSRSSPTAGPAFPSKAVVQIYAAWLRPPGDGDHSFR
jgi:hypothetical protein